MGIAICRLPRPGVSDPNEVRSCKHTRPVWVVPGLILVTWAKAGRSLRILEEGRRLRGMARGGASC